MMNGVPTVTKHLAVDASLAEALWRIYGPAIGLTQKRTPFRQGLTREEFHAAMVDQSFIKFLLHDATSVVGLSVVATDVRKISWLSAEFFISHCREAPFYYLLGLAVKNDFSKSTIIGGRALIYAIFADLPTEGFLFYDFSRLLHSSLSFIGESFARGRSDLHIQSLDAMELWEAFKH